MTPDPPTRGDDERIDWEAHWKAEAERLQALAARYKAEAEQAREALSAVWNRYGDDWAEGFAEMVLAALQTPEQEEQHDR